MSFISLQSIKKEAGAKIHRETRLAKRLVRSEMGYSFYNNTSPPPRLVRSNSCSHLVTIPNTFKRGITYTPRSSGFAHAGDTDEKREYIDKKETLFALADFLKNEAPKGTQESAKQPAKTEVALTKEQKCRRWLLEIFSRSLHKSRGEGGRRASDGNPVANKGVDDKENSGREVGVENAEIYAQAAAADAKEIFEFGWGNLASKEKNDLQKQPESEKPKQNDEEAGNNATGGAITTLDENFPSVPLQPPTPQFLDYDMGITEEYPHLVLANGERQEHANDRTVSEIPDQNQPSFLIHRANDDPNHIHNGIGIASGRPPKAAPLKPTQGYRYSPFQNSVHTNHSPTTLSKELNLKSVTTLPIEPYPKSRNYRSPPLGGEQATRVMPRPVRPPKSPDKYPRIGQHQGIDLAKVPGPALSGGKQEIKNGTGDIDGQARQRQRTDGAKVPRVYGSKEDIHDGIVFLPNITDTSFLHKCEQPFSPLNKSNQNSSPAQKNQVCSKPNCRLSPILLVAELEPAIATKTTASTTTNEPHLASWIFQGKATGQVSDMISTQRSPSPLLKERTPPPSKETPKEELRQHSNDSYNNNHSRKNNNNKIETTEQGQEQPPLSRSTMVAEIEMNLEAKFGARIAVLEKQHAVLNRLFAAVLDTASSTRLGGVVGVSKGDSLEPGAEEGLLHDRLSGVSTTSSLFTLEAKLDTLLALVGEGKTWEERGDKEG